MLAQIRGAWACSRLAALCSCMGPLMGVQVGAILYVDLTADTAIVISDSCTASLPRETDKLRLRDTSAIRSNHWCQLKGLYFWRHPLVEDGRR
jgi:hypothetical protein